MRTKRTCKHCPAWEPDVEAYRIEGQPPTHVGRCYLDPPLYITPELYDGEWDWWEHPITLEHDWCFRGQDLEA